MTIILFAVLSLLSLSMSNNVWTFTVDAEEFHQPIVSGNNCKINNENLVAVLERCPSLWVHLKQNIQYLQIDLMEYMSKISEPFNSALPIGTCGRIKVPATDWQFIVVAERRGHWTFIFTSGLCSYN